MKTPKESQKVKRIFIPLDHVDKSTVCFLIIYSHICSLFYFYIVIVLLLFKYCFIVSSLLVYLKVNLK